MGDIDVLKAQVVRRDVSEPWGFRLQGGADVGQPLTIHRVHIYTVFGKKGTGSTLDITLTNANI